MVLVDKLSTFFSGLGVIVNGYATVLSEMLGAFAEKTGIHVNAFFGIGLGLAVLFGLFGYQLIKLLMALGGGYVGYLAGVELFALVQTKVSFVMPSWLIYVFGGILALVMLCLAFAKFSYIWFGAVCIFVPYALLYPNLSLVLTLVIAAISIAVIRHLFIWVDSIVCAALTMVFLSWFLPEWEFLYVGMNPCSIGTVIGLSLVYIVFQYWICSLIRKSRERREADEWELVEE